MKIHQLLHGYSDGHGRLAGSLQDISPRDAARISQMSDWSGFRDLASKDNSYLTAYPLEDCSYYVVAKSWYASEMERPGCVWTHSLLIDLSVKDEFVDFRLLDKYFQRPTRGNYGAYNKPIEICTGERYTEGWKGKKLDEVSLTFLLSTLLTGEEAFSLKEELEPWWNQQLCLTLVQFLPLGMLKKLSFSSGSSSQRKLGNKPISMQFVSMADGISLLSPPWAGKLSNTDFNSGLSFVTKGMIGEGSDVSTLIKVFSQDIGQDGKKYIGVAQLLEMLYIRILKQVNVSYRDILGTIVNYFPKQEEGVAVKMNFLGERITSLFCDTEQNFIYTIAVEEDAESHFTTKQINLWGRVSTIAENSPDDYKELIGRLANAEINGFGRRILSESFVRLSVGDTKTVPDNLWERLLTCLNENLQYLTSDKWLDLKGSRFNDVLWVFQSKEVSAYSHWEKLLQTIMQRQACIDEHFVDRLYNNVDRCAYFVLDFLNGLEREERKGVLYTKAFKNYPIFLEWLSQQQTISGCVENMVINYIDPHAPEVTKSMPGTWRWLIKNDNGHKHIDTYIYMFELGYNWSGQDALDFYRHSFEKVHRALGEERYSDHVWKYVSRHGGKVYFFQEWDRCRKLRNGLVAHLKSQGIGKHVLKDFTTNMELNETLMGIYDKI